MKVKHYAIFKNTLQSLSNPEAWHTIRTDPAETAYYVPDSYEDRSSSENDTGIFLVNMLESDNTHALYSIGSGVARLEVYLKRQLPNMNVTVSDYNDSILKIKETGIFDDCQKFNVLADNCSHLQGKTILMNHLDTEFSDDNFRYMFSTFNDVGIKKLIFIPTQFLTIKTILVELKIFITALVRRKKRTYCGIVRSKNEYTSMFERFFDIELLYIGKKPIFVLTLKHT
jgi:hypothetical protein